jgi:hypothetical protein
MAMVAVAAVGLAIFYTLFTGMLLFSKNNAMNLSHEEARVALLELERNLHSAVSLPELTDSNGNVISGQGPAAGVEFQVLVQASQNCQITGSAAPGQDIITVGIPSGYPTPYSGMRLIIPAFQIEQDVTAVTISGSIATCTLANNLPIAVNAASGNVTGFFTQRVYYYVTADPNLPPVVTDSQGDTAPALQLNYIGLNKTKSYVMAASGLTAQTPFSIPNNSNGTPNFHNVLAANLSALDPSTSSLITRFKFNTASIALNAQIPVYSTLTTYQ